MPKLRYQKALGGFSEADEEEWLVAKVRHLVAWNDMPRLTSIHLNQRALGGFSEADEEEWLVAKVSKKGRETVESGVR